MSNQLSDKRTSAYPVEQEQLIQSALRCLEERIKDRSKLLSNPFDVNAYLRLQLGRELNEIFGVIFLNSTHRMIAFEKLFFGTINATTIYPRVVVQRALAPEINAAAVILVHNHPGGTTEPSEADKAITQKLKDVLELIDVRMLDHFIVTPDSVCSFAERGLL
jgi:DNA repair protein RadC